MKKLYKDRDKPRRWGHDRSRSTHCRGSARVRALTPGQASRCTLRLPRASRNAPAGSGAACHPAPSGRRSCKASFCRAPAPRRAAPGARVVGANQDRERSRAWAAAASAPAWPAGAGSGAGSRGSRVRSAADGGAGPAVSSSSGLPINDTPPRPIATSSHRGDRQPSAATAGPCRLPGARP